MRKNKLFIIVFLVLFWLSILTACAQGAAPGEHELINLDLFSSQSRTTNYAIMAALADIANKQHPWLRISHAEGTTDLERIQLWDTAAADAKQKILWSMSPPGLAYALRGMEPYPKKFEGVKIILQDEDIAHTFVTYNSQLKTPSDLIGKKLGTRSQGHGFRIASDALLKDGWGILEKCDIVGLQTGALKDGLITGMIDAALCTNVNWGTDAVQISSYAQEIVSAKTTYWINISKEDVDKVNAATPYLHGHFVLRKGSVGTNIPPADVGHISTASLLVCGQEVDDKVVYELVKLIDENSKLFGEYIPILAGGAMNGKFIANAPMMTKDNVHPGAWKYYKERGYVK